MLQWLCHQNLMELIKPAPMGLVEKTMPREKKTRELETHHNQAMTPGAQARVKTEAGKPQRKKVIALQLNEKEQLALAYLGGIKGLKSLLCQDGICIVCREAPAKLGTYLDAFCTDCSRTSAPLVKNLDDPK